MSDDRATLLDVEQLRVHYPVRGSRAVVHAVDDVSLTLAHGQTLGVVGESGCGKSTLARAILQLVPVTSGTIRWCGTDVRQMSESTRRQLRRDIRIVFQDPLASLNPRMTIGEIVREPLDLFAGETSRAERERAVATMLERVGLSATLIRRYPHEFSGGQCQRINIARALVGGPRLLVCDESVSALDVSIRAQILNLLTSLQRESGVAMLFVSHDLSVVRHISQRVLVMYLGRVMEHGAINDIFTSPRHPYTRALLDAIPLPDPARERARHRSILQGDLPSPLAPPSGCVFRTRCPIATPKCGIDMPLPSATADGSIVACHYAANHAEPIV